MRLRNQKRAVKLGYAINPHLPTLDSPTSARSLTEATDRLLCLTAVVASAYGFPKNDAKRWLSEHGLDSALAESEREFLASESDTDEVKSQFRWQVETIWAMSWGLQLVRKLNFAKECSDKLVKLLPDPREFAPLDEFSNRCKLRSVTELLRATDLAYCLHWSIMQAYLNGKAAPGRVPPLVVVERRRALEWLISEDDWDEVCMDT
ncbi:MAG: DUF4272 domain-containing protein [Phycisphaerales bacterium JB050]